MATWLLIAWPLAAYWVFIMWCVSRKRLVNAIAVSGNVVAYFHPRDKFAIDGRIMVADRIAYDRDVVFLRD